MRSLTLAFLASLSLHCSCGANKVADGVANGIVNGIVTGLEKAFELKGLPLLGSWSRCYPWNTADLVDIPVKSTLLTLSFDELGQHALVSESFIDSDCTNAFMPEEKANAIGTYAASAQNEEGIGTLDILTSDDGEAPVFISYKIEDDRLYLASACDQDGIDQGTCAVIAGNSPENRATLFDEAEAFARKQ